jgi:hypothetical protein
MPQILVPLECRKPRFVFPNSDLKRLGRAHCPMAEKSLACKGPPHNPKRSRYENKAELGQLRKPKEGRHGDGLELKA